MLLSEWREKLPPRIFATNVFVEGAYNNISYRVVYANVVVKEATLPRKSSLLTFDHGYDLCVEYYVLRLS